MSLLGFESGDTVGDLVKTHQKCMAGEGNLLLFFKGLMSVWVIPVDNVTLPFNERSFSLPRTVVNVETHSPLGIESK